MAGVFDIDIDDGMQRVSLMKFTFKIGSPDGFTNSESTIFFHEKECLLILLYCKCK
jgi:hypothetical protein